MVGRYCYITNTWEYGRYVGTQFIVLMKVKN